MQDKNHNKKLLMAMVGAYLVYTGGSLIVDVINGKPENAILFLVAGAAFVLMGGATAFFNLKAYWSVVKADVVYTDEEVEIDEELENEGLEEKEPRVREHRAVDMVTLNIDNAEDIEEVEGQDKTEEASVETEKEDDAMLTLDLTDAEEIEESKNE